VQYNAEKVDNWAEVEHARTRRAPAKKNLPVRRAPARAGSGKASARRGRGRGSDTDDDDDDGDSDDDGSDYDGGGRSGGRKRGSSGRRPTARARKATAGGRRSGRAAAGGVSYADDAGASDIYFSDEESDAEAAAAAAAAAAKPASLKDRQLLNLGLSAAPPQVEKLLTSRPAAGGGVEYLVKWKVRAHMHSTWVAEAEVAAERGGAARIARLEARMAAAPDEEPIDPQFLEVERVVAAATGPFGPARKQVRVLLCKWRSLPYASCTWELASSVNDDDALARFEQRERPPIERRLRKHTVGRQAVQPWAEAVVSPPYRAGNTLRPYQLEGLNWLSFSWHEGRNVILADEMGLGKTVQSVSLLHYLYSQQQCRGPFLVVAPLSCVPHWTREIEAWTDLDCVLYHGDRESRAALHEFEWRYAPGLGVDGLHKFNVVVTTFEMILEKEASLKSVHWNCMIVDEAHRLKNASSRLSQVLSSYSIDHTVLLTGTPLQNSKEELFTLLNFVASDEFPSVDNFDRRFGALDSAESVERLNTAIKPFLLRRMKADVEKSVPPKEETIVEVELTGLQKKYYRAIYERNTHFLNKVRVAGGRVLSAVTVSRSPCVFGCIPGRWGSRGLVGWLDGLGGCADRGGGLGCVCSGIAVLSPRALKAVRARHLVPSAFGHAAASWARLPVRCTLSHTSARPPVRSRSRLWRSRSLSLEIAGRQAGQHGQPDERDDGAAQVLQPPVPRQRCRGQGDGGHRAARRGGAHARPRRRVGQARADGQAAAQAAGGRAQGARLLADGALPRHP
jgi:hypothetical protein